VFDEADAALGYPLSALCFGGPENELQLTANTQPAILATSIAALRAVAELAGVRPQVVAGHSLGEYSALVCAGALRFADAIRLVHLRGRFMQDAVPAGVGAMAAVIGLDAETVAAACTEAIAGQGVVCQPANLNGAGQVVIAGHAAAVERAMSLCKQRGAKLVKALPVSAPFHCALMAPAAERLAAELAGVEVGPLTVPVVTNVEAEPNQDAARVKDLLVRQVTGAVRWEQSVLRLVAMGVTDVVEIGAGRVLTGLCKRIAPSLRLHNVETPAEASALKEATGG
jgi:[acyl-carrier-protein] S-malonyltransferase